MGFVFFDTETTGLNAGFDQIIQFGAIRTDARLNEIERFEARCRLLPYVVPHPQAILTNGASIERLLDRNLPSFYGMMKDIRAKLLAWSPSIFVGYNSIRFDEEMLRHGFFQTLFPPYLTSLQGNCRTDVLNLVMAAAAARPDNLTLPVNADGRPSFRLDDFASANGLRSGRAHDAMSDAEVTLKLCRLIERNASELWQRFVRFSKKATVADFVDGEDAFYLTEFFGSKAYHSAVACIGGDPAQGNLRLCLRLEDDAAAWRAMSDAEMAGRLASSPSPLRQMRVNAAPALTSIYDAPDFIAAGADVAALDERARELKNDKALCARLVSCWLSSRQARQASPFVEKQLHDRFPGRPDEALLQEFHASDWASRVGIVQRLEDERLRCFGRRLIYCESRSVLDDNSRTLVEREFANRLLTESFGGLTLTAAVGEIDALIGGGAIDGDGLLQGYRAHLIERERRVRDYQAGRAAA